MGTTTEPRLPRVPRPESDWRTFATGCRRPMAPRIVSRPERTTEGALALSSTFPTRPETRPDDDPDHIGRRRTPRDAGPSAKAAGFRRRGRGRNRGERPGRSEE